MIEVTGLDHILLAMPANKEDEARHFYGTLLGLTEVPKPQPLVKYGGCWFKCADFVLHLGVEKQFSPARKAHPAFRVTNLPASRTTLEAAGYTVIPDYSVPHVRRFYVDDPFGNRLEFIQEGDELT